MMYAKRGRPKNSFKTTNYSTQLLDDKTPLPEHKDGLFKREMFREDGTRSSIWIYPSSNPLAKVMEVIQCEEDGSEPIIIDMPERLQSVVPAFNPLDSQEHLPKSSRKYLAPNGKWVGYTRARMLNLVA